MTPAQLVTLAAHIRANTDPLVVAALANGADNELSRLYSLEAVPAFIVWRRQLGPDEWSLLVQAGDLDSITAGNSTKLGTFRSVVGTILPWRADHRAFVDGVFSGTAGQATRAAMLAGYKRAALLVEKVFATGTGSDASPATLTYEGTVSADDIGKALRP